ncbi:MAG: chalcone isomerase family protein [Gammaproteobacteria bacterium]|nr:chalcone isomerase family protein [Gammaproteobacteria bacterium]
MRYVALLTVLLLTGLTPVQAREIAGITVPETVKLHSVDKTLTLNGAGVRRKFFMSIYVGALYLPSATQDAEKVLSMPGAKRLNMQFVYSEIRPEKLIPVWNKGFEDNLSPELLRTLRPRIANFNGLFPTLHKGDRVDIDIVPGVGTQVWINDSLKGKVSGDDFAKALLRIWLGEKPADTSLKRALLGGD